MCTRRPLGFDKGALVQSGHPQCTLGGIRQTPSSDLDVGVVYSDVPKPGDPSKTIMYYNLGMYSAWFETTVIISYEYTPPTPYKWQLPPTLPTFPLPPPGLGGVTPTVNDPDFFSYHPPSLIASVPEPSTLLLVGSGLIGLIGFRKKLRK